MGSAAYRRGSTLLRQHDAREQRPAVFGFMDELNAYPRHPEAGTPFGPVRLLYDTAHNVWWIQDAVKGDHGWGYYYPTLWALVAFWHITITAYDATTGIWQAVPT